MDPLKKKLISTFLFFIIQILLLVKTISSMNIEKFCNKLLLEENFKKCVKGYHLINSSPIIEKIWEDINASLFTSVGIDVLSKSNGSHAPGMDIQCTLGGISNKSGKYSNDKKSIDISSYRLTTVCNAKNYGTPQEIIQEINKRKNFDYYSFIIRDESFETPDQINYDWLLIPSNYLVLDPSSYAWEPMIGKRGKNKDVQIGWTTNEINGCKMVITFSMSSQLWMHVKISEEIKQFIVASAVVTNKPCYDYIQIADNLKKNNNNHLLLENEVKLLKNHVINLENEIKNIKNSLENKE